VEKSAYQLFITFGNALKRPSGKEIMDWYFEKMEELAAEENLLKDLVHALG
jgi:hypothetical protein